MFESMKRGMSNTRMAFTERMNVLLDRGPKVDEEFWDGLEEALILSDVGAQTAFDIVEDMRDFATRKALPDAYAVMDALAQRIAGTFTTPEQNLFEENPVIVLFVGINGAGKTTTVGKIAAAAKAQGRQVLLGSGDTFRAAAIEQLEEWSQRADVEIVQRERGSDPASVCFDTVERAEALGSDLVLIDTAGRLHTSDDLMRELQKVVNVVRKRAEVPVRTVLVIDATTGQNGLSQAQQFNKALDLDAIIVTKLDGTAKGGIALAVSHELGLPIAKVGVGESLEDLQDFDAFDFSAALIGAEPEYVLVDDDGTEHTVSKDEFEEGEIDEPEDVPDEPDNAPAELDDVLDEPDDASDEDIDEAAEEVVDDEGIDAESDAEADEAQTSDVTLLQGESGSSVSDPISENEDEAEQPQEGRMKRLWKWLGSTD